jgi:ribonuclease P protein component
VLPAGNRLRRRQEFEATTRRGRRAGRNSVVVHVVVPEGQTEGAHRVRRSGAASAADVGQNGSYASNRAVTRRGGRETARERRDARPSSDLVAAAPRVGFVVSRAIGGAVGRNAVRRRLRHLMRDRLDILPDGSTVVVRALPSAATASAAELGAGLDAALARALVGGRG